ncbi:hypothetical protein [Nitrospirillum sp. BR 11828]|uniref:hypothetical protein n=1 Tax=Nitrospirillum sp. BR 11828 TaxID=3104325 RepID=UPI002AC9F8E0|nr:hypothetical protein [Nitrospirillum sp. BR 11828]MDZ5650549.1 hypothetical protein [Nitrospirillum sp. BR 11828]
MENIIPYDAEEIRRKLERAADELDAAGDPILARRLREIVDLDRAGDGVPSMRLAGDRPRGWTPVVVMGGASGRD